MPLVNSMQEQFKLCGANACLLVIAFTTVPGWAQLQNPDFELPGTVGAEPQGWTITQGKFMQDDRIHASGQFAGKLDGADGPAAVYQDVAVEPGKAYMFTGQWRNGDKTADFDVVALNISWLDKPGGAVLTAAASQDSGPLVGNWKAFQAAAIAPPDAHAARLTLKSRFGIGAFDGLNWGETDPAVAQSIINSAPQPNQASTKTATPTAPNTNAAARSIPPLSAAPSGNAVTWLDNLNAGRQAAASQAKPILIFFADADSQLTQYLDKELINSPVVASALSHYVLVRVPFAQNKDLAYQLKVFRAGSIAGYDAQGNFKLLIQDQLQPTEIAAKLNQ